VDKKELFPIEVYKTEINNLKTDSAKQAYWKHMRFLDQQILLGNYYNFDSTTIAQLKKENNYANYADSSQLLYDSVAIDNMIRSTIMLEAHGNSMNLNDRGIPLLIFIHNGIYKASKNYWANILLLDSLKLINNRFPAYPLEGLALDLYKISLVEQDSLYPYVLEKYRANLEKPSPEKLSEIYYEHKKVIQLKNIDTIGVWVEKPFYNMELESSIMIVKKADKNYYYESGSSSWKYPSRLNKKGNTFFFEDDLLGWYLQVEDNGHLTLRYQTNEIKIDFPIYKQ
jgi:hypothetical protein